MATVSNIGQRAIDLDGQLPLSDGSSALRAGPVPIIRSTTPAPGDHGRVAVPLGEDLPDGP